MIFEHFKNLTSDLRLELTTAVSILEKLNTPISLSVYLKIKYECWDSLIEGSCKPTDYEDVNTFADAYLAVSLLKKSPNLPSIIDRRQAAIDSFFKSESNCKSVNQYIKDPKNALPVELFRAKQIIAKTLGPLRTRDLEFIQSNFRFGPGATTAIKGRGSVLSDKYDEEIHLTAELTPYYRSILGDRWWDSLRNPIVVEGSKFTTVPKNAKTDRGIAIEPTLNIYVQLGIGALLKSRLKQRLGFDTTNQEGNKIQAQRAYEHGLATIDLSAASDSISYELVKYLLPWDWFVLLSTPRCEKISIDGSFVNLEKFSSMGNGYTFELETLIFGAIALSVVPQEEHLDVNCYGDDLIVPAAYADTLIDVLGSVGFSTNREKSFLAGNFFESCGADWFKGQPVRPFYLRRSSDSQIPYALQIANALRLYASQRMLGVGCDRRFRQTWRDLYYLVPKSWRNHVPPSMGDTGLIVDRTENRSPRCRDGLEGWVVTCTSLRPKHLRKQTLGLLLSRLACPVTEIASLGREPRRGIFGSPVRHKTIVSQWSNGLAWI